MSRKALWWTIEGNSLRCLLCPHSCLLRSGETGKCGVRTAVANDLKIPGYGKISAEAADPIEKKPLYHFYPGEIAWSVGFVGCNLNCPFCQNYRIARAEPENGHFMPAQDIVGHAIESGARILAYTYSEPTVHIEYLLDCSELAAKAGLKNVLVTNGSLNRKPAAELLNRMDAVNIDLKSWSSEYYQKVLGGNLNTVTNFIEEAIERCWVELTTLVVPDDNDSSTVMKDMVFWISSLSRDIPLHLSAYHPSYKYNRPPTAIETLKELVSIASQELKFVYPGNCGFISNTVCPVCDTAVIRRMNYRVESILNMGCCPVCETRLPGVYFDKPPATDP